MVNVERLKCKAMGTDIELMIPTSAGRGDDIAGSDALGALQAARVEMNRLEQLLSRFIPTSDISRLNDHPGEFVAVANETAQVLLLAEEACRETHGLFSPCLGAWMEHYGYDRSYDLGLDRPVAPSSSSPGAQARSVVNPFADLAARLGRGYVPYTVGTGGQFRLERGYKLDLGGIAKGWIVEQAAEVLHRRGYQDYLCSAGGDMVCAGREGDKPWAVGIADPRHPAATLLTLSVESSAVATSGTYRRRWTQGGMVRHHILDPRTGQPAESDLVSVTVVHERLTAAEVAAKVVLLLGCDEGLRWLGSVRHRGWVAVTTAGEVLHAWQ